MKTFNLDPAEEWLAQYWLGNLYSLLNREEIASEIKMRLDKYVYNLLEITKQYYPPYNPELLFEDRKIVKKIETQLPNNRLGWLIPTFGGFIMKIKSDEPAYRKRFTIAHEIGHTFFYDIKQNIPSIRFIKSKSRYWVQEDYANEIAGTILLPEPSLKKIIVDNKLSPSLKALEDLSKLYEVSYDVLYRRIVRRLNIWDCIIFRSTIDSDGTIRIDSTSVAKGISYKNWNMPKVLRRNSTSENKSWNLPKVFRENLYLVLAKVFKERKFLEEELEDEDNEAIKYLVQSKLLKKKDLNLSISLIVKKRELDLGTPLTKFWEHDTKLFFRSKI